MRKEDSNNPMMNRKPNKVDYVWGEYSLKNSCKTGCGICGKDSVWDTNKTNSIGRRKEIEMSDYSAGWNCEYYGQFE